MDNAENPNDEGQLVSEYEYTQESRETDLIVQSMRYEQNLFGGIIGGALGALIGAGLWAVITVITESQLGIVAIGVGYLVGFGVRKLGKSIDMYFRIIGAVMTLIGIAFGNLLVIAIWVSRIEGIPFFMLLRSLDIKTMYELLKVTFEPIDLVFYAIGVQQAYMHSSSKIDRNAIIAQLQNKAKEPTDFR